MWKPFRFKDLPDWLKKEWNPHNFHIKGKLVKVYYGEPYSYKVLFTRDRWGYLHIRCWRKYNQTNAHTQPSAIKPKKMLIGVFVGLFCIFFVIIILHFYGPPSTPSITPEITPSVTATPTSIPTTILQTTDLATNPLTRIFPYVLRANHGLIQYTPYKGVYQKLSATNEICDSNENPYYCYVKYVNNPIQEPYLNDLVNRIKSESSNPDDQVRIAVSMVQHIPYDFDRPEQIQNNLPYKIRHPYEVLYENEGDCGEHSFLLAYILEELGYGVRLLYFPNEPHMVVGLKCPQKFSYKNTGYAFIETTQPSIMTYFYEDYENPEIIPVYNGRSFDSIEEEFNDAQQFKNIILMDQIHDEATYNKWRYLVDKYDLITSS